MDGVLAYFDKAARALCGDDYARMGKTEFWTRIAAAPNFFLALDCTADGYDLCSTVTEMLDDNNDLEYFYAPDMWSVAVIILGFASGRLWRQKYSKSYRKLEGMFFENLNEHFC